MGTLADEQTTRSDGIPSGREYLHFASSLIALLLVSGVQLQTRAQRATIAAPSIDPAGAPTVSSR
jgi:hypothetical protein